METNTGKMDTVDKLNSFLRGELAAVESYRIALEKLSDTVYRGTLNHCLNSHVDRVHLVTQAIVARGGEPVKSSGAWGVFARMIESGAAAFGEKSAIAALEEGEDHGKADYDRDLDELDPSAQYLVDSALQPQQQRTHNLIRDIKRQVVA